MKRIGLLSDTHGYLDESLFRHFESCDELWHAGDFGTLEVMEQLQAFKPLRGVYGNIDGADLRAQFPEELVFTSEEVRVLMRHIGGAPPRYNPETRAALTRHQPDLFVSGHSHILKIMYDDKQQCLHMNPGAAGKQGWHKMRTMVRFVIDGNDMRQCEVIELGKR